MFRKWSYHYSHPPWRLTGHNKRGLGVWLSDCLIDWLVDWLTYRPINWILEYVNKIGKSVIILKHVKDGKGFYPDNNAFTWMDWVIARVIDCRIVRLTEKL